MAPSIAIIDYGSGNLRSVSKAFAHLGADVVVTSDAAAIADAPAVVLPGVGAFGDAMTELGKRGIADVARERAVEARDGGRPFLGICVGMQILVDEGEEDPGVHGLGAIAGTCPRIRGESLKVPQIGWNLLNIRRPSPLLEGIPEGSWVYFVHSYRVEPADPSTILATVEYGGPIVAILERGNLFATQFHPEKSQRVGLQLLRNFASLVGATAARQ